MKSLLNLDGGGFGSAPAALPRRAQLSKVARPSSIKIFEPPEVELLKLRAFAEAIDFQISELRRASDFSEIIRLTLMKSDCWKAIGQLTVVKLLKP